MSFLDAIFKLFARPESTSLPPAEAEDDHDRDSAVAVLEPPPNIKFDAHAADEEPALEEVWWVPKGEPRTTLRQPNPKHGELDRNLYDALVGVLRDPALELPRMSHVAQRGLQLLNYTDVDFGRLAQTFATDAAIAAEILKVANSPLYRGVREINRLDLAIARLGRKRLHAIVLALTTRGLAIRTGAKTMGEQLWRRSLAAGVVMSEFGELAKVGEDEAFLVGLLHDVGILAVLRIAHDYQTTHGRKVPRELFEHITAEWHGHIGVRLAEAWNLPAPLPDLIGQHHAEPDIDDPLRSYRWLIQLSDAICDMLGYGTYEPYDLFQLPCSRGLGLARTHQTIEQLNLLPAKIEERLQMF